MVTTRLDRQHRGGSEIRSATSSVVVVVSWQNQIGLKALAVEGDEATGDMTEGRELVRLMG